MTTITDTEKYNIGKEVTLWGILVNFVLTAAKYLAGFFGRSQALIADATHSLGDLLTDFVTLWGLKYSRMPKDSNHPFGHGKIETIASSIVGMGLLGVGLMIGWDAVVNCIRGTRVVPSYWALGVAICTTISKEILFRYTYNNGIKINSKAVIANAYDHRSDALSSFATVLGIAGAQLGWPVLDPIAAVAVSLMILKTGVGITMEAAYELAETSVPETVLRKITSIVEGAKGVQRIGDIRARQVGPSIVIAIDIFVDPNLTVRQGHDISETVERAIQDNFEEAGVITVHVEPA